MASGSVVLCRIVCPGYKGWMLSTVLLIVLLLMVTSLSSQLRCPGLGWCAMYSFPPQNPSFVVAIVIR